MKINRSSWHYKLWNKLGGRDYYHVSLCSYVQRLFWMSFIWALIFGLLGGCFGVILWGIGCAFYYHTAQAFVFGGGFILLCSVVFGAIYFFIEYWPNRESKEPGIIGQWWQAKKDKVCPLIDFED